MGPEALTTNIIGRNVSSTCNSSGSALWASAKNIKPLVDANYHLESIEFAYHKSPKLFSPIYYQISGSKSRSPSGQAVLFGCPLELRTVGGQKKIPPILEYLLDSVHAWSEECPSYFSAVGQKHRHCTTSSLCYKRRECWVLANEIEQAWTGVEKSDRAIISNLVQPYQECLITVCPLRYTITES